MIMKTGVTRNQVVTIAGLLLVSVGLCITVLTTFWFQWRAYRNEEYALAFRYPANWSMDEQDSTVPAFLEQAFTADVDPSTAQEAVSGAEGLSMLTITLYHPAWAAEIRLLALRDERGQASEPENLADAMETLYEGIYYEYNTVDKDTIDFKGYKAVRRESVFAEMEEGILTAHRLITLYTAVGNTMYDVVLIAPSDAHIEQVNEIYQELLDSLELGPAVVDR